MKDTRARETGNCQDGSAEGHFSCGVVPAPIMPDLSGSRGGLSSINSIRRNIPSPFMQQYALSPEPVSEGPLDAVLHTAHCQQSRIWHRPSP